MLDINKITFFYQNIEMKKLNTKAEFKNIKLIEIYKINKINLTGKTR